MTALDRVFWAIVFAAIVHIAEEHFGGFIERVSHITSLPVTPAVFWTVNVLFVLLCVAAALVSDQAVWFRMSVAGLIFVNAALFHLVGAIRLRGYSPGMITGVLLYIPLAWYAYRTAVSAGLVPSGSWWRILLLGLAWHLAPLTIYLLIR